MGGVRGGSGPFPGFLIRCCWFVMRFPLPSLFSLTWMYHWHRCRLIIRDEDHSLSAHKWKAGAGEGGNGTEGRDVFLRQSSRSGLAGKREREKALRKGVCAHEKCISRIGEIEPSQPRYQIPLEEEKKAVH